jgi:predicted dienelactone hydrolase
MKNRLQVLSVCILCLVLLLAACSQEETVTEPEAGPSQPATGPAPTAIPPTSTPSSSSGPSESAQMPETEWHLVVIGDSSLGGLGKAFASRIEGGEGVQVVLHNHVLGGLSAGRVLRALQAETPPAQSWDEELASDLRQADVVVVFANPVDSVDPERPLDLDGCFVNRALASCGPDSFAQYTADLKAIWARILELRAGQPTVLRATDIYNPLVSPWNEAGVFDTCTECWENMSQAARLAAEAYNIPFLSRYDAFDGTDHDEDPREKGYIHADGEHPTELASQFTAELLSQMGYEPVSPPAAAMAPPDAQEPIPFPLSEPGPYYTGKRTFTFEDTSRDGRRIDITVFYPALLPEGSKGTALLAGTNRDPDLSGAPYPLILTEEDSGDLVFKTHLASHGFVMAIVRPPHPAVDAGAIDTGIVDFPSDFLFVLDQIASNPLEGLEGVIDSEHVGVTGHSWGGAISLALSGARIDPEFYLSFCAEQAPAIQAAVSWGEYTEYSCSLAEKWDEFAAYVGEAVPASEDGLWQAITDERIRAVLPIAPDGAWLYGERGLAMADRPMLIIAPTDDEYTPYEVETAYIFEHAGSPDRFMISFVGRGHMMVLDPEVALRLHHFATAFFGTYLQGRSEYRDLFSEDFVSQFEDLAWGVYAEK